MEAGRELDQLVAEKVMGWSYKTFPDGVRPTVKQWSWPNDECLLPYYSACIADAWQVFTQFTSRYVWYDDATDTWHCHLDARRRLMDDCRHHECAEEAPLAICLAALKAVSKEAA